MAFQEKGKYEADNGDIYAIRLSTEKYAAAGTPPTGGVTQPTTVKVSKAGRSFGLRPRGVTLGRTFGTAPDTFKKYIFLPALTPTAFASADFQKGATIAIDGQDWIVVGRSLEDAD